MNGRCDRFRHPSGRQNLPSLRLSKSRTGPLVASYPYKRMFKVKALQSCVGHRYLYDYRHSTSRIIRRTAKGARRSRLTCSASSSEESPALGKFHVSPRDSDILALLVPAIGSVFLDPAMQVIDTGTLLVKMILVSRLPGGCTLLHSSLLMVHLASDSVC